MEKESYISLGGTIILKDDIEQARDEQLFKVNMLHCAKMTQNKIKKAKLRLLI